MYEDDTAKLADLIAEYERLWKLMHDLDMQAASVDEQLVAIERKLPGSYAHSDCPPEGRHC